MHPTASISRPPCSSRRRRAAAGEAARHRPRMPRAAAAINDVLYHAPERRALQDVLTCIRETNDARRSRAPARSQCRTPSEAAGRKWRGCSATRPRRSRETVRFADRIEFSLDQLKYNYPDEPVPPGKTPQQHLEDLTWEGAAARYPQRHSGQGARDAEEGARADREARLRALFPHRARHRRLRRRRRKILCQGRGSAANSAVCFCARHHRRSIPTEIDLLFERFISQERKEPPDIDVDFEHERREEVIQDVYKRYGRERAAIAATVISYRPRSAIREVGKALRPDRRRHRRARRQGVGQLAATACTNEQIRAGRVRSRTIRRSRARSTLANELIGFPRHLSQHVGGFVLTRDRLDDIVPIGPAAMEDRTFIEWDKDDIDALGMMKVDVLALGMLTCIRKAFDLIAAHRRQALRPRDRAARGRRPSTTCCARPMRSACSRSRAGRR